MSETFALDTTARSITSSPARHATVSVGVGTVYYSTERTVSASSNDGSLTVGESETFTDGPRWLVSTSAGARVFVNYSPEPNTDMATQEELEAIGVPAAQFGLKFDGTDETTKFKVALNKTREEGKVLLCPAGEIALSSTIKIEDDDSPPMIVGQGKGRTIFKHNAKNAALFEINGATGLTSLTTFSSTASPGDTEITVASTTGMAKGDLLLLRSKGEAIVGEEISEEDVEGGSKNVTAALGGDLVRVREVKSATKVVLGGRLNWAYSTESDIRKLTPLDRPVFKDFTIRDELESDTSAAARGILLTRCTNIEIDNVGFERLNGAGIYVNYSYGIFIRNPDFLDMRESTTLGYGVVMGRGTANGRITGLTSRGGRHAVTTTASATEVAPQHWTISESVAVESAYTAFDTHPGSRFFNFVDCIVHHNADNTNNGSAFHLRGPDQHVINPIVNGAEQGVAFVDGADRGLVQGGVLRNCDVGIRINDSDNTTLNGGLRIENPIEYGINVETATAAWEGHMVEQHFDDVVITGKPSQFAIRLANANAGTIVDLNRVRIPDAEPSKRFQNVETFGTTRNEEAQRSIRATSGSESPIAETIPRWTIASEAITAPASKALNLFVIHLRKGDVLNKIRFYSGTQKLETGTHQFAGIYTHSSTKPILQAKSADLEATAWNAGALQTFTLTEAFTVPTTGRYFLGLLVVAGTMPNLTGANIPSTAAAKGPILNGIANTGIETLPTEAEAPSSRSGLPYAWVA